MSDAAAITANAVIPQTTGEASTLRVELSRNWDDVSARLARELTHGFITPFQHRLWLDTWYAARTADPATEPLIIVVTDGRQALVAVLPLHVRHWHGLRIAEFAGAADYNAPILGTTAIEVPIDPTLFWTAVRRAVAQSPKGCDLVRFRKMPFDIAGAANPLAALPGASPSALTGHVVDIGDDFDAYRFTLERTVRKELERSWRVFTKHDGAAFEHITDHDRALHVFSKLEEQQSKRMRELGNDYVLDDEMSSAFHRDLIGRGLHHGYVVLTALTCGEEIVATLLGIRVASDYLMVRISNAGQKWTNCSSGRLIIDRTMAAMHADGIRSFDFSVGTYDYKRRFGVRDRPLVDVTAAVSWRGRLAMAAETMFRSVRRRADTLLKRG